MEVCEAADQSLVNVSGSRFRWRTKVSIFILYDCHFLALNGTAFWKGKREEQGFESVPWYDNPDAGLIEKGEKGGCGG